MFQDDDGEWVDDECPRCRIGRIQVVAKPFLRLYHKQLFTIPDAVCYECDSCGYYEFDETNYDIIADMLDGLIKNDDVPIVRNTPTVTDISSDDDLPKQTKFPPA